MKKGFCVAVWDREDYTMEAEKQLKDRVVYKDIDFKEKILQEVTETNESFSRILRKIVIFQKRNVNILVLNLKRPPTSVKFNCYPRFISACLMF